MWTKNCQPPSGPVNFATKRHIECAFKLLGLSASGKIKTVQGNMFEFGRFFHFERTVFLLFSKSTDLCRKQSERSVSAE
jgi:hypothetical protein